MEKFTVKTISKIIWVNTRVDTPSVKSIKHIKIIRESTE